MMCRNVLMVAVNQKGAAVVRAGPEI
jgi:hypothetical protein